MEARQYQKAACKLGELVTGKFEWKPEHSEAFEELKNMLSSDTVQAYFDPRRSTSFILMGALWVWPQHLRRESLENNVGEWCKMPVRASPTRKNDIARLNWKL